MSVFITGGTGFLGRTLVAGLVARGEQVVLLVRAESPGRARSRIRQVLGSVGVPPEDSEVRVAACVGRLEAPGLGLSPEDRKRVLLECDSFLHCGATVRFDLPLDEARAINLHGTEALLELAAERRKWGRLARVDHVSTAFVAGLRTDLVREAELDDSRGHKNSYEQTKCEAEQLLRSAAGELPVAIYRPSVIVGRSDTGWTSSFHTLYWPIKVYAHGWWRTLPCNPDTPIDLVPVDFVSEALLTIRSREESLGRCFHIAAGPKRASTVGELAGVVEAFFPDRKPIRYVDPKRWMRYADPVVSRLPLPSVQRVMRHARFYLPYFLANPSFDNANMLEMLAETDLEVPDVRTYVLRLLRFCVDTDWGRAGKNQP